MPVPNGGVVHGGAHQHVHVIAIATATPHPLDLVQTEKRRVVVPLVFIIITF